jgi:hypothetical protein
MQGTDGGCLEEQHSLLSLAHHGNSKECQQSVEWLELQHYVLSSIHHTWCNNHTQLELGHVQDFQCTFLPSDSEPTVILVLLPQHFHTSNFPSYKPLHGTICGGEFEQSLKNLIAIVYYLTCMTA